MASQTSALPDGSTLTKPAYTDSADIAVINTNMDKIVSNINAENQALATLTYTGTVANLQTSLVSLANSMSIGEFHNIKYTAVETLAPFINSRIYGGTFKRTGSNYWTVTLEDPEGVPVYGTYRNGRWSWEPLALKSDVLFTVGSTFALNGAQVNFRTLADKSEIYFVYYLPKECASNVNSFTLSVASSSPIWFSGGGIGAVSQGAQAHNIALRNRKVLAFSLPVTGTIQTDGFGICELNANITFTA